MRSPAADVRAGCCPLRPSRCRLTSAATASSAGIGEGGMGTVYEAEQDNPRRTVALKVIRPGLVSPELVNRFSHEAQILGRLQHAGIAQVYEAGVAEDGRPFFAMEFIRGMPLDEYVRRHASTRRARLELLARVCDAVQHAHDKGVVHRDLKPGNILVDESGQPKVLDFGVAHVTAADLLTTASRTRTGQLLGTLSYMSPEQIAADPAGLDGRSDVYTLGVILFELLAHRLPYHLEQLPGPRGGAGDPARGAVAAGLDRHGVTAATSRSIVAKALEKDRSRRYAVGGRPGVGHPPPPGGEAILARKASTAERYWRWARRNPSIAVLGGVLTGVLVLATVGSLLAAGRFASLAERQGDLAAAERSPHVWKPIRPETRPARASGPNAGRRYRSNIAEASAAQQLQNSSTAERALEAAPEEHRNWEWRHFHSLLDGASLVLPVPGIHTYTLRLSPDGRQIAVGSSRGEVHLFDAATGRPGPVLRGYVGAAKTVEYSPDGRQLASGGDDGTIRIWDPATGRQQLVLRRGRACALAPPRATAPTARGSQPLSNWTEAEKDTYRLWDATTGQQLAILGEGRNFDGFNLAVAFRPDGKRVVAAAGDSLRMYDADTGRRLAVLGLHGGPVDRILFSPDGKRFVVTESRGTTPVYLRDGETGEVVAVLSDQKSLRRRGCFQPRRLAAGDERPVPRQHRATLGRGAAGN